MKLEYGHTFDPDSKEPDDVKKDGKYLLNADNKPR